MNKHKIDEFAAELRREHKRREGLPEPHNLACGALGAWSFCLSKMLGQWWLSAKLRGRSSNVEDWELLGAVCAAIGVPRDIPMPPTIKTDPEATHYWRWPI
jgi:hypothetical protein